MSSLERSLAADVGFARILLAAIVAMACADSRSTTHVTAPSTPSFDFADSPGDPSPIIVRVDGIPVRVITTDVSQNVMAIHGPVDNLPVCNNLTTRDLVDGQQVKTPSDAQGIRLLLKAADTHVEIYSGTDISPVFPFVASRFCDFIAVTPKLYEGIVAYDVNLGSSMTSFRWQGDVTRLADGAILHYVERQDVVTNPSGNSATTSSYIRLQGSGP
jgi:hypothetical protein